PSGRVSAPSPSCRPRPALLYYGARGRRPASCCLDPVPPTSTPYRLLMGVDLFRRDPCRLVRVLSRVPPATLPDEKERRLLSAAPIVIEAQGAQSVLHVRP